MKRCPRCDTTKAKEFFGRNRSNADGRQVYCRDCQNRSVREWNAAHPEAVRARQFRRKYGITLDDYEQMLDAQGGVCAICRNECVRREVLSVDHDHETGEVRGLLCHRCNTAIGLLDDDPDRLAAGQMYLSCYTRTLT